MNDEAQQMYAIYFLTFSYKKPYQVKLLSLLLIKDF
ncbi:hypothetical protein FLA105534_00539 [Flavobacterium bizetiae]|uniref:Uncharacterized protein n=1 Tax=Flavobacterium bizetiae TaxID=2704140 RepID=A0A6J4G803_9FLAO|nr:hypothetical protein FLA105534_00539 [Flavobacterium bizetiae]CAD5343142.1 hypothetical protein FLA105535_03140 [Flavobacterium bizetiae]CAD5346647.1 hypothetical protein FLA105534_00590 [Flavobacterium bizetiae]